MDGTKKRPPQHIKTEASGRKLPARAAELREVREGKEKRVPQHLKAENTVKKRPARTAERRERAEVPPRREEAEAAETSRVVTPGVSRSTILFEETLLPTVENIHRIDRKGLRVGLSWLAVLPVLLLIIRRLTDSSKVAFLIIWIIGMFIISAALIFVAYTDHELKRFLDAVKERVPAASDVELERLVSLPELERRWVRGKTNAKHPQNHTH